MCHGKVVETRATNGTKNFYAPKGVHTYRRLRIHRGRLSREERSENRSLAETIFSVESVHTFSCVPRSPVISALESRNSCTEIKPCTRRHETSLRGEAVGARLLRNFTLQFLTDSEEMISAACQSFPRYIYMSMQTLSLFASYISCYTLVRHAGYICAYRAQYRMATRCIFPNRSGDVSGKL